VIDRHIRKISINCYNSLKVIVDLRNINAIEMCCTINLYHHRRVYLIIVNHKKLRLKQTLNENDDEIK